MTVIQKFNLRPTPGEEVCDFCSSKEKPQHTFYCQSHVSSATSTPKALWFVTSDNRWCACPTCTRLVQENRWDELARRSTERFIEEMPHAADKFDELYDHFRGVHNRFREAWQSTQ